MGQHATAAVLRQRDKPFAIEEIDLPELGPGQLLVRMAGTGICHTDLVLRDMDPAGSWPIVLGHEGSGIMAAAGPGVTGVAVGDHVVLSFDSCGGCANCLGGHPAYCDSFAVRNLTGRGSGDVASARAGTGEDVAIRWFGQSSFASYAIATARNVVAIDRELPIELAGPLGCSLLTGAATVTNVLRVRPGDSLAVLGVGGVGMAAVMAAAHIGAARIVAIDLQQPRLDQALSLGATHVVSPVDGSSLTEAITATGGPVTHVFDTTGHPAAIRSAVDAMAPRGVCAIAGIQRHDLVLGPRSLSMSKVVTAIYEGDAVPQMEIPRLAGLWRTGRFPLTSSLPPIRSRPSPTRSVTWRPGTSSSPSWCHDDVPPCSSLR
jgi:aryl-alcohol dehydrogenase